MIYLFTIITVFLLFVYCLHVYAATCSPQQIPRGQKNIPYLIYTYSIESLDDVG